MNFPSRLELFLNNYDVILESYSYNVLLHFTLDFFPQRERSDSAASLQRWLSADERRTQYSNMNSTSMESAHSSSSRGSDVQLQGGNNQRGFGGSYSASTGCSSKVITNTLNISGRNIEQPNLAQVALALMKAKKAGQLPSAFGDKEMFDGAGRPVQPGGQGQPAPAPTVPPDVTSNMQQRRSVQVWLPKTYNFQITPVCFRILTTFK